MRPPRRLLEDSALPQMLRADLDRTRALPYPYDARSGLAALQGVLAVAATSAAAAPAAASAAPASAAAAGSASAAPAGGALLGAAGTKIGLAAAGAALVAASVLATTGQTVPRHAPQTAAQRSAAAPALRTAEQAIAAPLPEPDPAAALAPPSERSVPAPAATVQADRAAALRREIAQLGLVKAAAQRDPARAYRLAQQGHRAFARGMLRHEREGLAVLALFALERREHAERRARAFLARYPDSPLRARIEQQLRAGPDP